MVQEIELEETSDCQAVFDRFLRYLYTAEVSITTSTAVGILCLADKYNVGSLKELCTKYMTLNCRSPQVQNALRWYSWAKLLHLDPLLRQCYRTIAWNYMELMESAEWPGLDVEFVVDFVQSSELIVSNEFAVWDAVRVWLTHDARAHQLRQNAERLLPLVRFPQMLVPQLYQLEKSELAGSPECRDLVHELLSRAYRFRALCPVQSLVAVSFNEPFYHPRDYVDLIVDTVRIQSTLRFGIQVQTRFSLFLRL